MTARLLAGVRRGGPALSYAEHLDLHGPLPSTTGHDLIELAAAGGLRGRGGAGFPVARKMRTTAGVRKKAVVIANASEGEPASKKDRTLLSGNPHLTLDGLQLAARAVGATDAAIGVHKGGLRDLLRDALKQRKDPVKVKVVEVPDRYVSGEAGALTSSVAGSKGLPTDRNLPLAESGLKGRPTLVQNAETLADLAVLARMGAERYREVGTEEEPGTILVTLAGVREPQVLEVEIGTPIREALALGGGTDAPLQAVLVGGYYGAWLPAALAVDVPLSHAGLRAAGGRLGAGLVVALSDQRCGLAAASRVATDLAGQSARQCGPCLNGLPALAGGMEQLARGTGTETTLADVERWCGMVLGRGACSHPDGAASMVRSAIKVFSDDVPLHLSGGCGRPAGDELGVPA